MANIETTVTNAYESTLSAELSSVASTMQITDVTGLTVPFYLVIEPEDSGQREYVYITDLVSNTATIDSRYLAGSAAGSGLTHPNGSVVRMSIMSQHLTDINDRADDLQSQINAIGDHGGLTGLGDDDHTQYHNDARAVTWLGTRDLTDLGTRVHSDLSGLASDDHTQYHNDARAETWHDADDHSSLVANDADAIHDNVAGEIAAVTVKGSPSVNDLILIEDSAAGNAKKRATVSSLVSAAETTDHGALSGLGDDDHTQYLTVARHDADDHSSLSASDIDSGTLAFARIPTGTSSSTVAVGNHTHSSGANTVNQSFALYRWRNIWISTSTPSSSGRQTGDVWIDYS